MKIHMYGNSSAFSTGVRSVPFSIYGYEHATTEPFYCQLRHSRDMIIEWATANHILLRHLVIDVQKAKSEQIHLINSLASTFLFLQLVQKRVLYTRTAEMP